MNFDSLLLLDISQIISLIIVVFSLWGFALFTYWWWKVGRASPVFMYMTFFLMGAAIRNGVEGYERNFILTSGRMAHSPLWNTPLWHLRSLPVAICIVSLVIHMTIRFARNTGGSDSRTKGMLIAEEEEQDGRREYP